MAIPLLILAAWIVIDFCTRVVEDIDSHQHSFAWLIYNSLFTLAAAGVLMESAYQLS